MYKDQKTAFIWGITNDITQTSIFNVPINDFKITNCEFLFQTACACFKSQAWIRKKDQGTTNQLFYSSKMLGRDLPEVIFWP